MIYKNNKEMQMYTRFTFLGNFKLLLFSILLSSIGFSLPFAAQAQTAYFYVSAGAGNDGYDGSANYPVKTLYKALALANASTATTIYINVTAETYNETNILDLKAGLHIEGGFQVGNWLVKSGTTTININAAATTEQNAKHKIGFRAVNVTDWVLKDLNIVVPSATDRADNGKGTTVYGLYVNNSGLTGNVSPHSQLLNCSITMGDGYAGVNGTDGEDGADGGAGGAGGQGRSSSAINGWGSSGAVGVGVGSGSRKGGNGGAGGQAGNGGAIGKVGNGGNSGSAGVRGGNNDGGAEGTFGNGGAAGNNGENGVAGSNGADGTTTILNCQHVWTSYFLPADKGNNGVDGKGGGGGAGAGGGGGTPDKYVYYTGGGGGGGGAGGQGGQAGTAGTSGGGSFAIYCYEAFTPELVNTTIHGGVGGAGGQAGIGGAGGAGGAGGGGGSKYSNSGAGGVGGAGGKGGNGSDGEPGKTGAAYEIAVVSTSGLVAVDTNMSIPVLKDTALCGAQSITLTALPGYNATVCKWYTSTSTMETPFATSNTYTAAISVTTTFYVASANGSRISTERVPVTVVVNPVPSVPVCTHDNRCDEGAIAFSATVGSNGNTCIWYDNADNALDTATVWTTPSLSETTAYYLSTYNTTTGCKSEKISVNAIVYHSSDTTVLYDTICKRITESNITYTDNGFNFTTANTGDMTEYLPLVNQHGCDSVVKLNLNVVAPVTTVLYDTACANTHYNHFGFNTLLEDTVGEVVLPAQYLTTIGRGCDSLVIMHLWVNPVYQVALKDTICFGGVYTDHGFNIETKDSLSNSVDSLNGAEYQYVLSLASQSGCDSTLVLDLFVRPWIPNILYDTVLLGQSYSGNINGNAISIPSSTLGLAQEYEFHYQDTISACYRLDILKLMVLGTDTLYDTICTNAEIYNNTYFSLTDIDTLAVDAEHSFVVRDGGNEHYLYLFIQPTTAATIVDTMVLGEIYHRHTFHIDTISMAGHYVLTDTLVNSVGCDSVLTLQLLVLHSDTLKDSLCYQELTYQENGFLLQQTDTLDFNQVYEFSRLENDTFFTLYLYVKPLSYTTLQDTVVRGHIYTRHLFNINTTDSVKGLYTYYDTLTGLNQCDSIVELQLLVLQPDTLYDSICAGTDSYAANGFVLDGTEALVAFQTYFFDRLANDTLYTLALYVNETPSLTLYDTICHGALYQHYDFNIETRDLPVGDYTDKRSIAMMSGCDSVVTLNLYVMPLLVGEFYDTACVSYVWDLNYDTLFLTGDYQDTVQTPEGCDSIVTLHLQINQPTAADVYDTACVEYVWDLNHENYTVSGNYFDTLVNAVGCDSIVTLHLTVWPNYLLQEAAEICADETYSWHGRELAATGVYYDSLTSVQGCDSVCELALTVSPLYYIEIADTICQGDTLLWRGYALTTAGLHYDSLQSSKSCDSVYAVALTVHETKSTLISETVVLGALYNRYGFEVSTDTLIASNTYNYVQHLTTQYGCDSMVTLRLFIEPPYAIVWRDTVCLLDEYHRSPFDIETSDSVPGTYGYLKTVHTLDGDSTYLLTLTVLALPDTTHFYDNVCLGGTYVDMENLFYVQTQDSIPGTYRYERLTTASTGCDSMVVLHLTVNEPLYTNFYDTIIYGNAYVGYGFAENTANLPVGDHIFTNHYYAVGGCDSLVHLNLRINRVPVTCTLYDTVCRGFGYYVENDFSFPTTGLSAGTYQHSHVSGDSTTILYLTINEPVIINLYDTICAGNVYYQYDFLFRADTMSAGNYSASRTALSSLGCDSITTLHLTVYDADTTCLFDSVCRGEGYDLNGFALAAEQTETVGVNTFVLNLEGVHHCDSTVILALKVKDTAATLLAAAVCRGEIYAENGFAIDTRDSAAGRYIYVQNLQNLEGCDSTVTLTLSVMQPTLSEVYDTACVDYTWTSNSITYTESGNYQDTLTNAVGCDSIVTLHLTLYQPVYVTFSDTACDEYFWAQTGAFYMESGDYLDTLTTEHGCDSIVTLHLSIRETRVTFLQDTIVRGALYDRYDFLVETSLLETGDNYMDEQWLIAQNGCDSIVTLQLYVDAPVPVELYDEICQGDVYENEYYHIETMDSSAGIYHYTDTIYSMLGDTALDLYLTVWALPDTTYYVGDICHGAVYIDENFIIYTHDSLPGDYAYSRLFADAHGCDSVVTLRLSINMPLETVFFDTIYAGNSFSNHGFIEQTAEYPAGDYQFENHYYTAMACDSNVVLYLHIVRTAPVVDIYDTICKGFGLYEAYDFNENVTGLADGTYLYTRIIGDSTTNLHLTVSAPIEVSYYDTICRGGFYYRYGFAYKTDTLSAGTHLAVHQNITLAGCDSITNFYLTVNRRDTTYFEDWICYAEPYTEHDYDIDAGETENIGTQQVWRELTNAAGCDSIVILTLHIAAPAENIFYEHICYGGTYADHGFVIQTRDSVPGLYEYTKRLHTVDGCDSIVTLWLTIDNPMVTEVFGSVVVGTMYVADGFVVETDTLTAGEYQFSQIYYTEWGCDSIVILNLEILAPTPVYDFYDTVCSGLGLYVANGFTLDVSTMSVGENRFTRSAEDSVIVLHVEVSAPKEVYLMGEICQGTVYADNGFAIATAGLSVGLHEFTHSTYTSFGCDSITHLLLTVKSCSATTLHATLCQGESYEANGFNVTSAETRNVMGTFPYKQTLTNAEGCDSVVTLYLTVNAPAATTLYDDVCHGGLYAGYGFVIQTRDSAAGTYAYTQTLQTSQGCDSVVTLHLTIDAPIMTYLNATVLTGTTYAAYGFAVSTDTLSIGVHEFTHLCYTAAGCDSTVILALTVQDSTPVYDFYDTVCSGLGLYVANGFTLDVSTLSVGENRFTRSAEDSVIVLHLEVSAPKEVYLMGEICQGTVYADNGFAIATAGLSVGLHEFTHSTYTSFGCDSITHLSLTVKSCSATTLQATLCQGEAYEENGFNVTSAETRNVMGTFAYTQTLTNEEGCDSVVTLYLTVNAPAATTLYDNVCHGGLYAGCGFVIQTRDSAAGTYAYTQTLQTSQGCDSVVTLHLTIDAPIETYLNATVLTGTTYAAYGFAVSTDTLSIGVHEFTHLCYTAAGCDSTVILALTVEDYLPVVDFYDTICHGLGTFAHYPFSIQNNNLSPNHYFYTQTTNDTVYNLYLVVRPAMYNAYNDVICLGELMYHNAENGFTIATSNLEVGTYTYTHINYVSDQGCNCDSTDVLTLTVVSQQITNLYDTICQGIGYESYDFRISANEVDTAGDYLYTQHLQTQYGCDSTVNLYLNVTAAPITMLSDEVCQGEVYIGYDFAVRTTDSVAGTYLYTRNLQTARGCDSVAILQLTILPRLETVIYDTVASGLFYTENGFNVATAGVYQQNLQAENGCDSTVILHLTVLPIKVVLTECDAYLWNNVTYAYSGIYSQRLVSSFGLDSIVVLHLTITHSNTGEVYETSCDSFVWFDSLYVESGSYQHTLQSANEMGCDSVVTLHLTILRSSYADVFDTACSEYHWDLNDADYEESGDYVYVLENVVGCDSIVTLHLVVHQPVETYLQDSAMAPYVWEISGDTLEESGIYTYIYEGAAENGCDSIVVLALTITGHVGITEEATAVTVSLYPNPTTDAVNIRFEGIMTQEAEVRVYDVAGKLLQTERVSAMETRIEMNHYAPGVYFFRILFDDKSMQTLKVVKR